MTRTRCLAYFCLLVLFMCACSSDAAPPNVKNYNDPVAFKANQMETMMSGVVWDIYKKNDMEPPIFDNALSAAARKMANDLYKDLDSKGKNLYTEKIVEEIRKWGVTDSAVRTHVASFKSAKNAEAIIRKQIGPKILSGRFTHMGIGMESRIVPPVKIMVLLLSRRPVQLEPFPRVVDPGKQYLKGTLLEKSKRPRLLLGKPSGDVLSLYTQLSPEGTFRQPVPLYKPGIYRVELQVDVGRGPEVAALFDVTVRGEVAAKEKGPEYYTPKRNPGKDAKQAEQNLFELINEERAKVKKVQVVRNSRLDEVARAYAKELAQSGYIAHVNEANEDIADRMDAAKVPFAMVGENVAVNENELLAHKSLMSSPAHASVVLNNEFTQVGVGVVTAMLEKRRHVFVVQVFMKPK